MSGSIQRINTCGNCAYMDAVAGPQGKRQLLCRYSPPNGHPVVALTGEGPNITPQLLGTITVWPEVEPQHWCGRHSTQTIMAAREIPKQRQTFGGMGR